MPRNTHAVYAVVSGPTGTEISSNVDDYYAPDVNSNISQIGSEYSLHWITMIRFFLLCICSVAVCSGWHDPHIAITRAALASLPAACQDWFGPEAEHISETYCWNPDRYVNASAPEQAVMRTFCERPDGTRIHNVSWDRKADLPSVEYLLERLIANIRSGSRTEAAEFAGTLAHLIEDSLSPAHALDMKIMQDLLPPPSGFTSSLHAAIELSAPTPNLSGRVPKMQGDSIHTVADAILTSVYSGVHQNRMKLIEMVQAIYSGDNPAADRLRGTAAQKAAEILADAYYSAFGLAGREGFSISIPIAIAPVRANPLIDAAGLRVELSPESNSSAALNLLFGLKEALRTLGVDRQARRTPLGGIRLALIHQDSEAIVEISGDWPPYSGVQATDFVPGDRVAIARMQVSTRGRPDWGFRNVASDQWLFTADHRGDTLYGTMNAGSGSLTVRNHKGVSCTVSASADGLRNGAVVACPNSAPIAVYTSQTDKVLRIFTSGVKREEYSIP